VSAASAVTFLSGGDELVSSLTEIRWTNAGLYAEGVALDGNQVDFVVTTPGFYLVSATLNYNDGGGTLMAVTVNNAPVNDSRVFLPRGSMGSTTIQIAISAALNDQISLLAISTVTGLELEGVFQTASISIVQLGAP
jgi:hypothetical protein